MLMPYSWLPLRVKGLSVSKAPRKGVVNVPPLGALGLTYSKAVKLAGYLGGWPRPTLWAAKAADGIRPSSESRAGVFIYLSL